MRNIPVPHPAGALRASKFINWTYLDTLFSEGTAVVDFYHAAGQAILTLRALVHSERFDHGWDLLSNTYRREVSIPDNVVEFTRKRAA